MGPYPSGSSDPFDGTPRSVVERAEASTEPLNAPWRIRVGDWLGSELIVIVDNGSPRLDTGRQRRPWAPNIRA
jgi:hypothetical protein